MWISCFFSGLTTVAARISRGLQLLLFGGALVRSIVIHSSEDVTGGTGPFLLLTATQVPSEAPLAPVTTSKLTVAPVPSITMVAPTAPVVMVLQSLFICINRLQGGNKFHGYTFIMQGF